MIARLKEAKHAWLACFIAKTPEIIFEVISSSTARCDEVTRFECYEEQGINYYILVYPEDLVARICQHNGDKYKKVAECDTESFDFEKEGCPFPFNFRTIIRRFIDNLYLYYRVPDY